MQKIYLDNAATTATDSRVIKAMEPYFNKVYGNAGSLHGAGRESSSVILKARKTIAQILNCKPEEIIFTGSGTESDNLAILGTAHALAKSNFGSGLSAHIITSNIEHHAVLHPCEQLAKEGFQIVYSKVDRDGILILNDFKNSIKDETILVSIMYANNEIGTIQPIEEIGKIIKEIRADRLKRAINTPIFFHTDACQAAGYLDLDVQKLGVDLLTLNGSKIYGPKGTGVLYVRTGTKVEPLILGGGQEKGLRSGTENIAGIIGLAEALQLSQNRKEKESNREKKLRDYFIKEISKKVSKIVVNGDAEKRLPNNINISILDIEGEAMLLWLDKYGVFCSTGSACDSQSLEPSHVILALNRPYEYANGNLRFTLGKDTTKKDLDYVLKVLPKIVEDLRKISPVNVKV
ncbi:MAG: aminotransferase class V-fold PLP-dependent enzyme [Candidatus Staskawiczbacteria bacterium]|jgi:cysteine desulfurase